MVGGPATSSRPESGSLGSAAREIIGDLPKTAAARINMRAIGFRPRIEDQVCLERSIVFVLFIN
jgi:hypothetical protein